MLGQVHENMLFELVFMENELLIGLVQTIRDRLKQKISTYFQK